MTKILLLSIQVFILTGCFQMYDAPSMGVFELPKNHTISGFKMTGVPPEGTIQLGVYGEYTIDLEGMKRGRELYKIHCMVCHMPDGSGETKLAEYGLPKPASLVNSDLLDEPADYIYRVITHGRGALVSYRGRANEKERWMIAYYVKSMQANQQNDPVSFLSDKENYSTKILKGITQKLDQEKLNDGIY